MNNRTDLSVYREFDFSMISENQVTNMESQFYAYDGKTVAKPIEVLSLKKTLVSELSKHAMRIYSYALKLKQLSRISISGVKIEGQSDYRVSFIIDYFATKRKVRELRLSDSEINCPTLIFKILNVLSTQRSFNNINLNNAFDLTSFNDDQKERFNQLMHLVIHKNKNLKELTIDESTSAYLKDLPDEIMKIVKKQFVAPHSIPKQYDQLSRPENIGGLSFTLNALTEERAPKRRKLNDIDNHIRGSLGV